MPGREKMCSNAHSGCRMVQILQHRGVELVRVAAFRELEQPGSNISL